MTSRLEDDGRGPLGATATGERLSADDLASQREAQHLQAALAAQRTVAAMAPKDKPGVCTNCRSSCMPHAVYCDDDCRDDHQHRESVLKRQGRR